MAPWAQQQPENKIPAAWPAPPTMMAGTEQSNTRLPGCAGDKLQHQASRHRSNLAPGQLGGDDQVRLSAM